MNYFEFFGFPVRFIMDEEGLRQAFYKNSKLYHPDFFTLEDAAKQAEILEKSTYNNEAYKALSHFDRRMKYILELNGALEAEGQNKIAQDFLIEMMDINEQLMELEMDFDPKLQSKLEKELETLENTLFQAIEPTLESYDGTAGEKSELTLVKEYYLKKRYLLRIKENLNKFAGR